MTKEEQTITLNVAVCADSPDDQTVLKAYVKARGWKHSGHVYRFDNWHDVVADAKDGKFNTVCATYEGLRWLVHVAPETDFPRAQPKPKREPRSRDVGSDEDHHSAIIERAHALTAEDAQTAETIAASLVADGLLGGAVVRATTRVRRALLRSGEFAASEPEAGGSMRWRPWQPTKKSVEQPDGHTVIYTEVLSTTGIPVQIAIPVKSPKEIAEMLVREVMADSRLAPRKTEVKQND
jgi:hypothetical protein